MSSYKFVPYTHETAVTNRYTGKGKYRVGIFVDAAPDMNNERHAAYQQFNAETLTTLLCMSVKMMKRAVSLFESGHISKINIDRNAHYLITFDDKRHAELFCETMNYRLRALGYAR